MPETLRPCGRSPTVPTSTCGRPSLMATSTWSTAEKLENAALDAVLPSVDMSAGVAQVIWTQSDGSLNHMYSATLPQLALSAPVSSAATMSVTAAALESLYDEPLKKDSSALRVRDNSLRIDTARRSESLERVVSALAEPVAHRIADDARWANDNHHQTEVDDLFAQWESDPLATVESPRPRDVVRRVLCRNTNYHTPRRRVPHARRLSSVAASGIAAL